MYRRGTVQFFLWLDYCRSSCGENKQNKSYANIAKDEQLALQEQMIHIDCKCRKCPSRRFWFWLPLVLFYVVTYVVWFNCDSVVWSGARKQDMGVIQYLIQNTITFTCVRKNTNRVDTQYPRLPPLSENISNANTIYERSTTIVLMGYHVERATNYAMLFSEYTQMRSVDKVIFIWNNKQDPPPDIPYGVHLIRAPQNDLYNRYVLGQELIDSPYVLTLDDDIVFTEDLIMCLVTASRNYPNRLIGTDYRTINSVTREYAASPYDMYDASMVIGKTMMMPTTMRLLIRDLPDTIRKNLTDENSPCYTMDDIIMNGFYAKLTGYGPVFLSKREYPNLDFLLPAPGGNSFVSDWTEKRSACVNYAMNYFEYYPPTARLRCPCGRGFYGRDTCYSCEEGTYTRSYARSINTCSQCPAIAEAGVFPEYLPVPCRNVGVLRTILICAVLVFPVAYLLASAFIKYVRQKLRKRDSKYKYDANEINDEHEEELHGLLNENKLGDV